jgi:hypothetical protein
MKQEVTGRIYDAIFPSNAETNKNYKLIIAYFIIHVGS